MRLLCALCLLALAVRTAGRKGSIELGLQDKYAQLPELGDTQPDSAQDPHHETPKKAPTEKPLEDPSENENPEDFIKADEDDSDPPSKSSKVKGMDNFEQAFDPDPENDPGELEAVKNKIYDDAASKIPPPSDDVDSGPDPIKDFEKAKEKDLQVTKQYLDTLHGAQNYIDKRTAVQDWIQDTCLTRYCPACSSKNITNSEAGLPSSDAGIDVGDLGETGLDITARHRQEAEQPPAVHRKLAAIHREAKSAIATIMRERDVKIAEALTSLQ